MNTLMIQGVGYVVPQSPRPPANVNMSAAELRAYAGYSQPQGEPIRSRVNRSNLTVGDFPAQPMQPDQTKVAVVSDDQIVNRNLAEIKGYLAGLYHQALAEKSHKQRRQVVKKSQPAKAPVQKSEAKPYYGGYIQTQGAPYQPPRPKPKTIRQISRESVGLTG